MNPPSEIAERIHQRLRAKHKDCDPAGCALRGVWVEDVQEVLDHIAEEPTP